MYKTLAYFIIIFLAIFCVGCNNKKQLQLENKLKERVKSEEEISKLKKHTTEEEGKAINARTNLIKTIQNKEDIKLRNKLGYDALRIIKNNSKQILNWAYPFAFKRLRYSSANLIETAESNNGFTSIVRLNYKNLLNENHHLEVQFDYDIKGGYRSWKFINYSDIIEPRELTVGSLLEIIR